MEEVLKTKKKLCSVIWVVNLAENFSAKSPPPPCGYKHKSYITQNMLNDWKNYHTKKLTYEKSALVTQPSDET